MTKSFQKLLGHHFSVLAAFDASFCIDEHIVFPIFYLIAILHFLIVIIMRELKMRIWIYLLHFFFNLLARNPLVWWIHVCGNLDILVFFFLYTYIAASLRWCAFPIKHSKFIWFKGVFSLFLISWNTIL